jgi:tRNA pseudouridine38-40 synthase
MWWWYHGQAFAGYQSQRTGSTVQDTIVSLLRQEGLQINPVAAGRTDAGVHARMQVLSCRLPDRHDLTALASSIQAKQPPFLGLYALAPADPKFHAHFSAAGKTYRYRLSLGDSPQWNAFAWRCSPSLDVERVLALLSACVGTHRFDAFHDKSSSLTPRTITQVALESQAPRVYSLRIEGLGFARYQIRFLVGAAVQVALGEKTEPDFFAALRAQENRHFTRAPAAGLTLWEVQYPPALHPFVTLRRDSLAHVGPFASAPDCSQ